MAAAIRRLIKKKQEEKGSCEINGKQQSHVNQKAHENNSSEDDSASLDKSKKSQKKAATVNKTGDKAQQRCEVRTKRLMREFLQVSKSSECINPIFAAELVEESLFEWNVKLFTIDPDSPLFKDMTDLGHTFISLNLSFPENFPFSPPFMRVVKPKIEGGFVLDGGAICMELLTPSGWSSAYTVEAMIMQFAALVVKGKGRIDKASKGEFNKRDAESSFKRLVKTHERYGWITPPMSEG